ncbi:MAG TPA: xanthine dehydrogenase family protein molybdopterin-binding subunit, partial [Tepidisphaeraceae bacterium]|nr:xanthine dehydrogenase family protein molybdopterin-binding subunit [Tepidisphaeraceae bacterium]
MPQTKEKEKSYTVVGKGRARVDGPLKVTGRAMYASDHYFPAMLYAVPVGATIGSGKIESVDTSAVEKMPGVRAVYHRANIGKLFKVSINQDFSGPGLAMVDENRPPFHDDVIRYYGQYIAVVVADSFEQAKAAAAKVNATYKTQKPNVSAELLGGKKGNDSSAEEMKVESERGNAEKAFGSAEKKVDVTYYLPPETHVPIELHATVAVWDGDTYTLYESTQSIVNHRLVMAQMLGVPIEKVRVISQFLGSGFGGKLWPWPHDALACAAARHLKRPVKLVLSRPQTFESAGHRPACEQRIRIGASKDGTFSSIIHEYANHTSILDDYEENCGEATPFLYSSPNLRVTSQLVRRNIGTPTSMRGPGAVPGLFALECAVDELAIALEMDPIELRIKNEPKLDESKTIPFSSRHLIECYKTGADKFGWSKRTPEVGSMKRDGMTIGWGMAGATWMAARLAAAATVEMRDDGSARVACGTQDIGTGTYTVLAAVTAEKLGITLDRVQVDLGDTKLPPGPLSGGSMATASVIPAVIAAADKAIEILKNDAVSLEGSQFFKKEPDEIEFRDGKLFSKSDGEGMAFADLLKKSSRHAVVGQGRSDSTFGAKEKTVSMHSYGAQFAEVTWEPEIARLRVSRGLTVIDAGRIVNPLAGRNQVEGAFVMGIGMALLEEVHYDQRWGSPINNNLADYLVATNADHADHEVIFLDYPDYALN